MSGDVIPPTDLYSLEFESMGVYCFVSIRFWKVGTLCTVRFFRYCLASEPKSRLLVAISQVFSVISSRPQNVSVPGCGHDPCAGEVFLFQQGPMPFRFDVFSLPIIMHQRRDSVFGVIILFSQKRFFITFTDG